MCALPGSAAPCNLWGTNMGLLCMCVCVCVCVCVCARGGGACRAVRLARTYAQARVRLTHPAGTAIMWALTDLDPALHRHLTRAPSNMVTAL